MAQKVIEISSVVVKDSGEVSPVSKQTIYAWQYNGRAPWQEIVNWCQDNLYHGGHYEPNWYAGFETIYFGDPKEYTLFLLRWS